jgi:hypothetical protein
MIKSFSYFFAINKSSAMFYWSFALSACWLFQLVEVEIVEAFSPSHFLLGSMTCDMNKYTTHERAPKLFNTADSQIEDFEDWSDERKAGLFQFLLRDLEVEGVPLLGCDGVSANKTLQGATWTIAGQLSENDYERKVCLILEDLQVKDLKAFVEMFSEIKSQDSLMDSLHDLRRFSLSLVGNGIGPALILETQNRTETEIIQYDTMKQSTPTPNEPQWRAATESFIKRSFPGLDDNPIAYRFLASSDVCDILSGYWNCICELEASMNSDAIVLSCPPISGEETLTRFAAVSELINAMNSAYDSEYKYDLFYVHPTYDNDKIQSHDKAANGHIPPTNLLRETMRKNGDKELTDDELKLQNYQRKSPLPGIIIQRGSKDDENGTSNFDYQSITRLVDEGEEKLKEAVMEEMKLITESK